jgi:hypothetical protein
MFPMAAMVDGVGAWTYASLSRRVGRLGGDVKRIKARLDVVDAPSG